MLVSANKINNNNCRGSVQTSRTQWPGGSRLCVGGNTCGQRTSGSLQGRRQTTRWADDGALERRKTTHLGRHCCLSLGWVVHWWLGYECRLSGGSSSHTQSSQIRDGLSRRGFREDAHLPAGCRRKVRHDERVSIQLLSRAWAENIDDIRQRPWNLLSVPANFRFDTAFQRYPAARELCWWEPLGWLTIRVIISSINFCLPARGLKNNNTRKCNC